MKGTTYHPSQAARSAIVFTTAMRGLRLRQKPHRPLEDGY
jgi:hypothetical protein